MHEESNDTQTEILPTCGGGSYPLFHQLSRHVSVFEQISRQGHLRPEMVRGAQYMLNVIFLQEMWKLAWSELGGHCPIPAVLVAHDEQT